MAEYLGTKLGEWFFEKNMILQNQIDDIRYAFEILCSEILQVIIILTYSTIKGNLIDTIMYLVLFHVLRECIQGYHAKTISRCLILTIGAYASTMFLYPHINIVGGAVILAISAYIQYWYNKNKHSLKALIITLVLFTLGLLLWIIGIVAYIQIFIIVYLIASVAWLLGKEDIDD